MLVSEDPGSTRFFDAAACRGYPTHWWFGDGVDDVEAFVICIRCEVRSTCLAYALDNPRLSGIWAATTEQQRGELRRWHPSFGPPGGFGRGANGR